MNIGFVGFGEAGFHIAKGLRAQGVQPIAFDVNASAPQLGNLIQQRARESQAMLVNSFAELAQACEVLLSVVTAHSAVQAASDCAAHLNSQHIYADLNSVSPKTKGVRRAHEMEEATAMLRESGIEPMMAEATARRQAWGARDHAQIP
jgi:3-hydroxyisobutyrate dehydrogenase-like beta-hydroxyacid dehydrogenase